MKKEAYRLSEPPDALIATLENAVRADKKAERRTVTFGCLSGFAFLAGITGVVGGANLHWGIFPVGILGLFAFVVFLVLSILENRFDIDDRKLKTALRIVKVLRPDMQSQDRVQLMVDFRDYQKGGTALPVGEPRLRKYRHAWLDLRTRLADGTAVAATLAVRVTRREKPKRKRTKVNERFVGEVHLVLKMAPVHGEGQALLERLSKSAPGAGLSVASWSARGRGVRISLRTPEAQRLTNRTTTETGFDKITGDAVLHSLRWVFSGLAPTTRAA